MRKIEIGAVVGLWDGDASNCGGGNVAENIVGESELHFEELSSIHVLCVYIET